MAARHVLGSAALPGPGHLGEKTVVAAASGPALRPAAQQPQCGRRLLAAAAAAGTASLVSPQRINGPRRGLAAMAASTAAAPRAAAAGDEVLVRYQGRLTDGTVFDATEPGGVFELKVGNGDVVPGFDAAVVGLEVGKKVTVTVPPEKAYGPRNEDYVFTFPAAQVPNGMKAGMQVSLGGGPSRVRAVVKSIEADGSAVLDANPPLAGKTLVFDIELVGFKEPPRLGVEMVGWQGKTLEVPIGIANSRVSEVLRNPRWPSAWSYTDADFRRQDESNDENFYNMPRLVTHIDDSAIKAISAFYGFQFAQAPQGEYSVLDICSSWISHYPKDLRAKRVAVTGMNEKELAANKQATEYVAKDLNVDPKFSYGDNEFDFVTNVVSVDYLSRPREIFQEIHRVMKPGGVAIMSFSNRCFASKAIAMWVANMSDGPGHCQIVGNYFHFCPEGGWSSISSVDISPNPGRSDPMWVVTAVKA